MCMADSNRVVSDESGLVDISVSDFACEGVFGGFDYRHVMIFVTVNVSANSA
jgi:hypothetical protein